MRFWSALAALGLVIASCLVLQAAPLAPAAPAARPAAGGGARGSVRVPAPHSAALKPGADRAAFPRDVAPLVRKYCGACHGAAQQAAGIGLHGYKTEADVLKGRALWEKVAQNLADNRMPPRNAAQPTPAERQRIVTWIETYLSSVDCSLNDPGRVTMRRLNRAEYNNTVRDLLGVEIRPADEFPSDDVGYGYDNIGDVLSLSPLLMEKYLAAAEKIVESAIRTPETAIASTRYQAERLKAEGSTALTTDGFRGLYSSGSLYVDHRFPEKGEYLLRTRAYRQSMGTEAARMGFFLNDDELTQASVTAERRAPKVYEHRFTADAGEGRVAVGFARDSINPDEPNQVRRGRNLIFDYIEIVGPLEAAGRPAPASHRRIFGAADPGDSKAEAARKIVSAFARRAFRRPSTAAEVGRLVSIVDLAQQQGESFERGIQLAVQAVLVSPHFLFRVELDSDVKDPRAVHAVSDFELATRLSYFLWSTTPDDELLGLAEAGKLHLPEVFEAQARRLIADPRSQALVDNFGMQWLQLRILRNMTPDPKQFPAFNESLRSAMLQETELFLSAILREDRSILEMLDSRFTFVNEPLAKLYGLDWVKGNHFRKVVVDGEQRGGLLTQASILTITSNPTRTSPVKRGKWVLEQILGTPPPPPPPNVPALDAGKDGMVSGTLRQRMEQHRKDPGCATCHNKMDTLGFGLENFDAIGAWRSQDGDAPVDASGTLPSGETFRNPGQLKQILIKSKDTFARNFVQQMTTYALGRGLEYYDRCAVDEIVRRVAKRGYRFQAIVQEIVKSAPFRMRRGEGEVH